MKSKSKSEQAVNTKSAEIQKSSSPKEQIENTDLYKPVLNKIMTTQEQCVKYNFAALLISIPNVVFLLLLNYFCNNFYGFVNMKEIDNNNNNNNNNDNNNNNNTLF